MEIITFKLDEKFASGKYVGKTVRDVVREDPSYIRHLYYCFENIDFDLNVLVALDIPSQYQLKKPKKQPEFEDTVVLWRIITDKNQNKKAKKNESINTHKEKISHGNKNAKKERIKEFARKEISNIVGHKIVLLYQNTTLCQYRVNGELDLYIVSQKTFDLVNKVWDKYELGKLQDFLDKRMFRNES